jgi:hypothetical protein
MCRLLIEGFEIRTGDLKKSNLTTKKTAFQTLIRLNLE